MMQFQVSGGFSFSITERRMYDGSIFDTFASRDTSIVHEIRTESRRISVAWPRTFPRMCHRRLIDFLLAKMRQNTDECHNFSLCAYVYVATRRSVDKVVET